MKVAYIGIAIIAVVGWLAVGLFIAKGPQPEIIVPAEVITKLGPLNISNTIITTWMVMAVLIVLSIAATRSMKLLPSGFQNFIEAVVEFLVGQVEEIAGREKGRRFFVVVATIFLFVIMSNWMGLLPFFNAIGKTEDVGHEVFHEIALHEEEHPGAPFEETEEFAGVKMDHSGGIVWAKPRAKAEEFEIEAGQTAGEALDHYIVFLAEAFTDFKAEDAAGHDPEEGHALDPAVVVAAAEKLQAQPDAPKLLTGSDEHAEDTAESHGHGVTSPALGVGVTGIEFPGPKLALVIPFFRSVHSDINNTLALAIIAFVAIEFWGFQALGFGYLSKFFNLKGINSFVGILELLSEFIRIISFAFRLFGNIFAGEVLILMLTFLMPFLFVDIIYGLELFVGFIQAAVFALLTLVFAVMATESHGDEHHEEGHEGPHLEGAGQAHH